MPKKSLKSPIERSPFRILNDLAGLTVPLLKATAFPLGAQDPIRATLNAAMTSEQNDQVNELRASLFSSIDSWEKHRAHSRPAAESKAFETCLPPMLKIAEIYAVAAYQANAEDSAVKFIPIKEVVESSVEELQSRGCNALARLVTKACTP